MSPFLRAWGSVEVYPERAPLLCAPFGYVHTFSDFLYIFSSFCLIPSFLPLYPVLYMLSTSRSVSLSVVPIVPTESKSAFYLLTYYLVSYITLLQLC